MLPLLLTDGYKTDHRRQYPDGTQYVYANWTPRKSRLGCFDEVVFFGLQAAIRKYLIDDMDKYFFEKPKSKVIGQYYNRMVTYLGEKSAKAIGTDHIEALWNLHYLPLKIKALPEGTLCPIKVPMFTMTNTHPDFFWLTNHLETLLSCCLWSPCTSATLAHQYRKVFNNYNAMTGVSPEFTKFQGHDFSFRGMSSVESAMASGAGHLLSFAGTDTIPALDYIEQYYGNGLPDDYLIGTSVFATEHSVTSAGGQENEFGTIKRLITEIYPSGIISIVSDTWDFWNVLTNILPRLKDIINSRDGKVVIRPDSGDPVKIICGDPNSTDVNEHKGATQLLWEIFGGETRNGIRHLNPKIGLIYGDSITLERQRQILNNLQKMGFATDIVLGIGSYTYQYNTRDTFGFAIKATHCVVNNISRNIQKDPKTDKGGEKKSLCGLIKVFSVDGKLQAKDQCTVEEEREGLLRTVFTNSTEHEIENFQQIRERLNGKSF